MTEKTMKELIAESMKTLVDLELLSIVSPVLDEIYKIEKEYGKIGKSPAPKTFDRVLKVIKNSKYIQLQLQKDNKIKTLIKELRDAKFDSYELGEESAIGYTIALNDFEKKLNEK